jgi:hypothetical protein
VEIAPEVPLVDTDASLKASAHLESKIDSLAKLFTDQSERLTQIEQRGLVTLSKVDQSTSDKWVNRGLLGCVFVALLIPSPLRAWKRSRHR